MRLFPLKPTLVILTLIALMKAPDALPAFKNYKVLDFHNIPDVLGRADRGRTVAAASRQGSGQLQNFPPDRSCAFSGSLLRGAAANRIPGAGRNCTHSSLRRLPHPRRPD